MELQDKKITMLGQLCYAQKINLVITPTGAIVQERIFKGIPKYKASYEKGKVKITDTKGKQVREFNFSKPVKLENKAANKKKSKDDKTIPELQDTSI